VELLTNSNRSARGFLLHPPAERCVSLHSAIVIAGIVGYAFNSSLKRDSNRPSGEPAGARASRRVRADADRACQGSVLRSAFGRRRPGHCYSGPTHHLAIGIHAIGYLGRCAPGEVVPHPRCAVDAGLASRIEVRLSSRARRWSVGSPGSVAGFGVRLGCSAGQRSLDGKCQDDHDRGEQHDGSREQVAAHMTR
jgi:hypothetical protein